jgi:hypothetical protein
VLSTTDGFIMNRREFESDVDARRIVVEESKTWSATKVCCWILGWLAATELEYLQDDIEWQDYSQKFK